MSTHKHASTTEVINSYTENAGVAGQNNKQVAAYADLGEAGTCNHLSVL